MTEKNSEKPEKKVRVGIVGSCVSRDPFELCRSAYDIQLYIARSSFSSMFGKTFDMDVPLDLIASPWQRSMVESDIKKLAKSTLINSKLDVLVIDFIDERFGLIDCGGTFATNSLSMTEIFKGEYGDASIIRNGSDAYRALWVEGWSEFVKVIRSIGLEEKCVLHKVRWASVDSMARPFKEGLVSAGNKNLEWCYQTAESLFPEMKVIETPAEFLVSDADHKWGPAPYHYINAAQSHFLEQLNSLVI